MTNDKRESTASPSVRKAPRLHSLIRTRSASTSASSSPPSVGTAPTEPPQQPLTSSAPESSVDTAPTPTPSPLDFIAAHRIYHRLSQTSISSSTTLSGWMNPSRQHAHRVPAWHPASPRPLQLWRFQLRLPHLFQLPPLPTARRRQKWQWLHQPPRLYQHQQWSWLWLHQPPRQH